LTHGTRRSIEPTARRRRAAYWRISSARARRRRPRRRPEPFNQPFFLNITAALGMGLNAVNGHTPMPATTRINWVRVWQYG
jgi:hypothetical protein